MSPHWPPTYVPEGVVSPIQSLWVDEGRDPDGYGRVADPAATAAAAFATALAKAGVDVAGAPAPATAPAGVAPVATLLGPAALPDRRAHLETSSNGPREVPWPATSASPRRGRGVLRRRRRRVRDTPSARSATAARGAVTYDGSGLSPPGPARPITLTSLLDVAGSTAHPGLRSVMVGLPIAGSPVRWTPLRRDRPRAQVVQASPAPSPASAASAGIVTDRNRPLLFALLADRIDPSDTLGARSALDDVTDARVLPLRARGHGRSWGHHPARCAHAAREDPAMSAGSAGWSTGRWRCRWAPAWPARVPASRATRRTRSWTSSATAPTGRPAWSAASPASRLGTDRAGLVVDRAGWVAANADGSTVLAPVVEKAHRQRGRAQRLVARPSGPA